MSGQKKQNWLNLLLMSEIKIQDIKKNISFKIISLRNLYIAASCSNESFDIPGFGTPLDNQKIYDFTKIVMKMTNSTQMYIY